MKLLIVGATACAALTVNTPAIDTCPAPQPDSVQKYVNVPAVFATNVTGRVWFGGRVTPSFMKRSRKNPCVTSLDRISSVTESPTFTTNGRGWKVNSHCEASTIKVFAAAALKPSATGGTLSTK